jgi:hypothetical protein
MSQTLQNCTSWWTSSKAPPNKALQTDKAKLSRLLHSQESRQLAFAAELGR